MSFRLLCHHCKQWLGESSRPMELIGLFKHPREVERIGTPRDTWRCKGCGWANVFQPALASSEASWREVELKRNA